MDSNIYTRETSGSHHEGDSSRSGALVANLSPSELERLSAYYGSEVYSMVDDAIHREIIERNSAMRETVKNFGKDKLTSRSKVDMAGAFITISRDAGSRETPVEPSKGVKEKRLRDVLGLSKFYSDASRHRVPFMVMLDVELARLLEWLSPSEEERAAKEMVLLKLELVVSALFPNARMRLFGSCEFCPLSTLSASDVSGLSLPGSDVDVCIGVDGHDLTSLKLLVYALSRLDLLHSFECVFNTPVPVVKAIDKNTGVRLDISIWQNTAWTTTMFVKEKVSRQPMDPAHTYLVRPIQVHATPDHSTQVVSPVTQPQ